MPAAKGSARTPLGPIYGGGGGAGGFGGPIGSISGIVIMWGCRIFCAPIIDIWGGSRGVVA